MPAFGTGRRKGLYFANSFSLFLSQPLLLANSPYNFVILFHASTRVQACNIPLSTTIIDQSIKTAHISLQLKLFSMLVETSSSKFQTLADVGRAVCRGDYWALFTLHQILLKKLQFALIGNMLINVFYRPMFHTMAMRQISGFYVPDLLSVNAQIH